MTSPSTTSVIAGLILLSACSSCPTRRVKTANSAAVPTPVLVSGEDRRGCVVGPVPHNLSVHPFYEKYCDAGGIPILSSQDVEDRALQQAYYLISNMLAPIPEVRAQLLDGCAYIAIIGTWEELTALPEYSRMDSDYWDQQARALGGSPRNPLTSAPEENLVCARRDRYYGESILVHEFAHTIHLLGLGPRYDTFTSELTDLYDAALAQGLWANTYAGANAEEYWAEGVQSYFNTNLTSNPSDGVHNQVATRDELSIYDPGLYQFISRFFRDFDWTPTCLNGDPQ